MPFDLSAVKNPVFDREPLWAARDPALAYDGGIWRCFHSAFGLVDGRMRGHVDVCQSRDLARWEGFARLTTSPLGFSSPGNILKMGEEWVMCVQSYPIHEGQLYGGNDSRLWLMRSRDLVRWGEPEMIKPDGCTARWAPSPRQIDPYLVEHDGRMHCFYKANGALGVLVSTDMSHWEEAAPDAPVLSRDDTPDGATVENPCVIRSDGAFVMFFAPCRAGRGIGIARSYDLLHWTDVRYLDFPALPWADGGPTAPFVMDAREQTGRYVMAFHGDRRDHMGAALGIAFSDDLERWEAP